MRLSKHSVHCQQLPRLQYLKPKVSVEHCLKAVNHPANSGGLQ